MMLYLILRAPILRENRHTFRNFLIIYLMTQVSQEGIILTLRIVFKDPKLPKITNNIIYKSII